MEATVPLTLNKTSINYLYWTLLTLIAIFFTISGMLEITKNPSTYHWIHIRRHLCFYLGIIDC